MTDDFQLFPDDAGDADAALIMAYLARELTPVQVAAVEERLATDAAFRESVWPIIEAWFNPSAFGATSGTHQSVTPAEIEAGWQRVVAHTGPDERGEPVHTLRRLAPRNDQATRDNTRRRTPSMKRIAAVLALIVLPMVGFAQIVVYAAHHSGVPGHRLARAIIPGAFAGSDTPRVEDRPIAIGDERDSGVTLADERPAPVTLQLTTPRSVVAQDTNRRVRASQALRLASETDARLRFGSIVGGGFNREGGLVVGDWLGGQLRVQSFDRLGGLRWSRELDRGLTPRGLSVTTDAVYAVVTPKDGFFTVVTIGLDDGDVRSSLPLQRDSALRKTRYSDDLNAAGSFDGRPAVVVMDYEVPRQHVQYERPARFLDELLGTLAVFHVATVMSDGRLSVIRQWVDSTPRGPVNYRYGLFVHMFLGQWLDDIRLGATSPFQAVHQVLSSGDMMQFVDGASGRVFRASPSTSTVSSTVLPIPRVPWDSARTASAVARRLSINSPSPIDSEWVRTLRPPASDFGIRGATVSQNGTLAITSKDPRRVGSGDSVRVDLVRVDGSHAGWTYLGPDFTVFANSDSEIVAYRSTPAGASSASRSREVVVFRMSAAPR